MEQRHLTRTMEHTYDTGEIVLNYAEMGSDPSAPPLVLLHRLTSRWQSWNAYLPALADDWSVYAPDLRGHGLSSRGAHYRALDYAQDITAFLLGVVRRPVLLFGHSGGALAAMHIAAQSPELVQALLISEPPLYLLHDPVQAEPSSYEWFTMVESAQEQHMPVEAIAALLQARFPRVPLARLTDAAEATAQVDPGVPRAAISGELVEGFDLESILPRITCPVIFLQGEKALGGALWDEDTQRIRELQPEARIEKMHGVGHNTTDPVPVVLGYLRELR